MNSKFDLSGYEVVKQEHTILKERREKLGLTQQQVADAASINIRQYQKFESGERGINGTSFRIGVAIADVLELDVHELTYTPTVAAYLKEKREYDRMNNGDTSERSENNND